MNAKQMEIGFNRWMDDFINRPEGFKNMQAIVNQHLAEKNDGKPTTYGERCTAILAKYAEVDLEILT